MNAHGITLALGGQWQGQYGLCCCPAHNDAKPSLKVRDDPHKLDGIDVHCFSGCDWRDVKTALSRLELLDSFENGSHRSPHTGEATPGGAIPPPQDDSPRRVSNIWRTATPLAGTLGEKYFNEVRGIEQLGEISHAVRWHKDLRAVVALMTDPVTGEPCGIHRTYLNEDGSKRERKMLGHAGVVRLSPDEDVTLGLGLTEGIEDGLAVLCSGWRPIWAGLSCGGIERLPVLPGIEALTIFQDRDEAGIRAAEVCAQRWTAAGQEVFLV